MDREDIIQASWEGYEKRVVPAAASKIQRKECKRAFLAGVLIMMEVVKRIGREDISEERGVEILEEIDGEIRYLYEELK